MNVLAAALVLAAVVVFLVDWSGRAGRSLICLGLALFAGGVLVAAVWPAHLVTIN